MDKKYVICHLSYDRNRQQSEGCHSNENVTSASKMRRMTLE